MKMNLRPRERLHLSTNFLILSIFRITSKKVISIICKKCTRKTKQQKLNGYADCFSIMNIYLYKNNETRMIIW